MPMQGRRFAIVSARGLLPLLALACLGGSAQAQEVRARQNIEYRLIAPQPVVIARPAVVAAPPPPLYLYVPPGHAKNWAKHCAKYQACGQPVYFVQERWYSDVYAPHYRERGGHPGKGRKGHKND